MEGDERKSARPSVQVFGRKVSRDVDYCRNINKRIVL